MPSSNQDGCARDLESRVHATAVVRSVRVAEVFLVGACGTQSAGVAVAESRRHDFVEGAAGEDEDLLEPQGWSLADCFENCGFAVAKFRVEVDAIIIVEVGAVLNPWLLDCGLIKINTRESVRLKSGGRGIRDVESPSALELVRWASSDFFLHSERG